MENGCHIIVEKPMAITVEECDEIIEVSKKNETKVCIAHSGLFYPPFIKARKLVSEGVIGDFKGMRIFLCTPTDYMTSHEDHWANKLTGGVIGETGPHVIYMTLAFINPIQEIKSYALKQLPYPWSPYEDYKIELIGKNAASTITTIYSTNQWAAHVDIWGTEGLLKLDLELMNLNIHRRKNLNRFNVGISGLSESLRLGINVAKAGTKVLLRRYKNTHDLLIEGFLDSIIKNRPLPVPAEEGREVVRVMKLIVDNLEKEKEQKV
jgi:predicted dehydrogenase